MDRNRIETITNDSSSTQKNLFPNNVEKVFFENNLPKTKPITVGIVNRPTNQTSFIKTLNENLIQRNLIQLIKNLTFLAISI